MSDPHDKINYDKRGLLLRTNTNPKYLAQKIDMLQAFTEEAVTALKNEIDTSKQEVTRQESGNLADLFKALDDTHQQFKNKLMKNFHQTR